MKNTKFYIPVFLLIILSVKSFSQEVTLNGVISIQNSKYNTGKRQYVENAEVNAPFSKSTISDAKGEFKLVFVGMPRNTNVKVTIDKSGLEVVNEKELMEVIIDRKIPLSVYMAEKGKLAELQVEYYNISKEALEKNYRQALSKKDADIEKLQKQYEESLKNLPEYVEELAAINLDDANKLYITAYEYFKKGEIDSMIVALDQKKINEQVQNARRKKEIGKNILQEAEKDLQQAIDNYELKAKGLRLQYKFTGVAACYDSIIAIRERDSIGTELDLAKDYSSTAFYYSRAKNNKKAIENSVRSLGILFQQNIQNDSYYIPSFLTILEILGKLEGLGEKKDLLNIATSFKDLIETNLDSLSLDRARFYDLYATILDDYNSQLEYYQKALRILKKNNEMSDLNLANSYSNIASAYSNLGQYENQLTYSLHALKIFKTQLDSLDPRLAIAYEKTGEAYLNSHEFNNSLKYILKSVNIKKSVLNSQNIDLAYSYNTIGILYKQIGNEIMAINNFQHSSEIFKNALETFDYKAYVKELLKKNDTTNYSSNVEKGFQNLLEILPFDQYRLINFLHKSIDVEEQLIGSPTLNKVKMYYFLGSAYGNVAQYKKQLIYYRKGLETGKAIVDSLHPNLASLYSNIGMTFLKTAELDSAKQYFEKFENDYDEKGVAMLNWSAYYAVSNEPKQSIEYLKKAVKLGYKDLKFVKDDETLDNIRELPEFKALVQKVVEESNGNNE